MSWLGFGSDSDDEKEKKKKSKDADKGKDAEKPKEKKGGLLGMFGFGDDDDEQDKEKEKEKGKDKGKNQEKTKAKDEDKSKQDNGLLTILTTDGITETMTPTARKQTGSSKPPSVLAATKLEPGVTLPRAAVDDKEAVHKWQSVPGSTFNVRKGPDYKNNKQKGLSMDALYDCFAADCFFSEQKIVDLSTRFRLPTIGSCGPANLNSAEHLKGSSSTATTETGKVGTEKKSNSSGQAAHIESKMSDKNLTSSMNLDAETLKIMKELEIPPLWIINSLWPAYPPPNPIWGGTKEDGENYSLVMWCRLSAVGVKAIKERSPAALLLSKFIKGINDPDVNDRFKCIPRMAPHSTVQLPWFLSKYNETPFLTRPQHKFVRHKDAIEAVVDVHQFTYIVRKGFSMFFTSVKDMVADYAFTIEAREDDEMDEQILLCMRVCRFDYSIADIVD